MPKTKLSDEEKEKAEKYFNEFKDKKYTDEELSEDKDTVMENEDKIMDKMNSNALSKFLKPAKLFFMMLKDYFSGKYKDVPVGSICAIIMTLLYVFSPLDIIPDVIPVAGLLDDAAVMGSCVAAFGATLKKYEEWKNKNSN